MATNSSDKFVLKNFYFWGSEWKYLCVPTKLPLFTSLLFLKGKCVLLFATQTIEVYI